MAGSSAGAIVCAVVASGASMEEALQATKILAQDCRSRGTAFRLGAVLREVLESFLPEDAHIRLLKCRWFTYLNSDFKKGGWSHEEDMFLCEPQKISATHKYFAGKSAWVFEFLKVCFAKAGFL
ncbi:hypothetical protein LXL04_034809 [Taraxacum kok-saghyz]